MWLTGRCQLLLEADVGGLEASGGVGALSDLFGVTKRAQFLAKGVIQRTGADHGRKIHNVIMDTILVEDALVQPSFAVPALTVDDDVLVRLNGIHQSLFKLWPTNVHTV